MSENTLKLRNVGPKSAAWLRQVGIRTHDDLARLGAVEAFLKVKRAGFKPSLNLLYAMVGTLEDCHWAALSAERKQAVLLTLDAAESINPIRSRWDKADTASAQTNHGVRSMDETADESFALSENDGSSDLNRFD